MAWFQEPPEPTSRNLSPPYRFSWFFNGFWKDCAGVGLELLTSWFRVGCIVEPIQKPFQKPFQNLSKIDPKIDPQSIQNRSKNLFKIFPDIKNPIRNSIPWLVAGFGPSKDSPAPRNGARLRAASSTRFYIFLFVVRWFD